MCPRGHAWRAPTNTRWLDRSGSAGILPALTGTHSVPLPMVPSSRSVIGLPSLLKVIEGSDQRRLDEIL
jgi:hypothetical protein